VVAVAVGAVVGLRLTSFLPRVPPPVLTLGSAAAAAAPELAACSATAAAAALSPSVLPLPAASYSAQWVAASQSASGGGTWDDRRPAGSKPASPSALLPPAATMLPLPAAATETASP